MSEAFIISHNGKCSKSRKTLELLKENGIDPEILDYLGGELSRSFIEAALLALGVRPKDIIRVKEEKFKELNLDLEDDEAVVSAILKHPQLLERPIVMRGKRAVIGRPPERVLELLDK